MIVEVSLIYGWTYVNIRAVEQYGQKKLFWLFYQGFVHFYFHVIMSGRDRIIKAWRRQCRGENQLYLLNLVMVNILRRKPKLAEEVKMIQRRAGLTWSFQYRMSHTKPATRNWRSHNEYRTPIEQITEWWNSKKRSWYRIDFEVNRKDYKNKRFTCWSFRKIQTLYFLSIIRNKIHINNNSKISTLKSMKMVKYQRGVTLLFDVERSYQMKLNLSNITVCCIARLILLQK